MKAGQPALTRALELQRKASTVGFDWNDPKAVLAKIREEADEIEAELDATTARDRGRDRRPDVRGGQPRPPSRRRPGGALRATNPKFERRFAAIEDALAAQGKTPPRRDASGNGCVVERRQG